MRNLIKPVLRLQELKKEKREKHTVRGKETPQEDIKKMEELKLAENILNTKTT